MVNEDHPGAQAKIEAIQNRDQTRFVNLWKSGSQITLDGDFTKADLLEIAAVMEDETNGAQAPARRAEQKDPQ